MLYKYSTKKGNFYGIRFRCIENGREVHKNMRGFTTQRDAKAAKYEHLRMCEAQRPLTVSALPTVTLGEVFDRYMIYARNAVAPTTLYEVDKIARRYLLPKFGNTPIAEISKKDLSDWQEEFPMHLSYKYKSKLRYVASVLFAYAVDKDIIAENTMQKVKPIPNPSATKKFDYWTLDDFQKFIAVVDDKRWAALFTFLYLSGCRKGEALALTWADVDFVHNLITIDKTYSIRAKYAVEKLNAAPKYGTKNKKTGKIYMPKKMMEMLKELERHAFVFGTDTDKELSENYVLDVFKKYIDIAGVKKIRLHDLRHSCAALIISQSDSELTALYAIAERLRDTPEQILKTYGHLFPSRQRELNKKLDKIFS